MNNQIKVGDVIRIKKGKKQGYSSSKIINTLAVIIECNRTASKKGIYPLRVANKYFPNLLLNYDEVELPARSEIMAAKLLGTFPDASLFPVSEAPEE